MELRSVQVTVASDIDGEPLGQRVGDGRAHAVQTAGIGILSAVEFRARVQLREDDFHAADFEFRVFVDGDTSAVVGHSRDVVVEQLNRHGIAEAVCDLVDAVVDYLPKNVVQAFDARRTDVHTGAFSDRVESFENTDITRFVFVIRHTLPCLRRRTRDGHKYTYIKDYTTISCVIKVFGAIFLRLYEIRHGFAKTVSGGQKKRETALRFPPVEIEMSYFAAILSIAARKSA